MEEPVKSREDLEHEIAELRYRLDRCIELLSVAKCPQSCTGNCAWCYERKVEVRPHTNEKTD